MSNNVKMSPEVTELIYVLNSMIEAAMPHIPKEAQLDIGGALLNLSTRVKGTDLMKHIAGSFGHHFPTRS
ncbi:hypothetical protein [Komagataeibacter xylinus]|uniref:Uncharacterized protein n=1 Tax=Komagataeibacter xylinus TaxID=28448 RepID=A0A857FQA7_KOMXY|nr:hypothetical protein [Komagataeibacter xylinus]QHC35380.1 hypothetical protein FMA36_07570 [Komagataeibacter xylinus]